MSEILVPSTKAKELSEALWALERPPQVRRAGDVTDSLFPIITDIRGGKWLAVHDDFSILVHPEAVLDGIAEVLQPLIDAGQLPPNANKFLGALIIFKRGKRLVIYDAFPQFFKDQAKTYEQMIDAGLLPTQNIL